jgi:hypothetical protein
MLFMMSDIFLCSFILAIWIFFFFVFDELILKGYFKLKLQKRFKVDE